MKVALIASSTMLFLGCSSPQPTKPVSLSRVTMSIDAKVRIDAPQNSEHATKLAQAAGAWVDTFLSANTLGGEIWIGSLAFHAISARWPRSVEEIRQGLIAVQLAPVHLQKAERVSLTEQGDDLRAEVSLPASPVGRMIVRKPNPFSIRFEMRH